VIVIFSTLLSVASGAGISAADFLRIPSSFSWGLPRAPQPDIF
jgi:hypothetical protein